MFKHNLNKTYENICAFDLANKHWHVSYRNENVCCLLYDCLISTKNYLLVSNASSPMYLVTWI
jgi:hypothetical protein